MKSGDTALKLETRRLIIARAGIDPKPTRFSKIDPTFSYDQSQTSVGRIAFLAFNRRSPAYPASLSIKKVREIGQCATAHGKRESSLSGVPDRELSAFDFSPSWR
jgi:hypothetical protein